MNPNHDEYGRFASASSMQDVSPPRKVNHKEHKESFLGDITYPSGAMHQLHKAEGGYKVMHVEYGHVSKESAHIPGELAKKYIEKRGRLQLSSVSSVNQYRVKPA